MFFSELLLITLIHLLIFIASIFIIFYFGAKKIEYDSIRRNLNLFFFNSKEATEIMKQYFIINKGKKLQILPEFTEKTIVHNNFYYNITMGIVAFLILLIISSFFIFKYHRNNNFKYFISEIIIVALTIAIAEVIFFVTITINYNPITDAEYYKKPIN